MSFELFLISRRWGTMLFDHAKIKKYYSCFFWLFKRHLKGDPSIHGCWWMWNRIPVNTEVALHLSPIRSLLWARIVKHPHHIQGPDKILWIWLKFGDPSSTTPSYLNCSAQYAFHCCKHQHTGKVPGTGAHNKVSVGECNNAVASSQACSAGRKATLW